MEQSKDESSSEIPSNMTEFLERGRNSNKEWSPPEAFDLSNEQDKQHLEVMITTGEVRSLHDCVGEIIDELYDLDHPEQKDNRNVEMFKEFQKSVAEQGAEYGTWFYFPWSGEVVRYPDKDDWRRLRTSRNRELITPEEQEHLYDAEVAVFGLSVGSSVVENLLTAGVGGKIITADRDIISPSNLNRLSAGFADVGTSKVSHTAKRISEVDPYIEQVHLDEGVDKESIKGLQPNIIIDEVDDLPTKLMIRRYARENRIPVVMATDVGERSLIDIERYDNEDVEPFNGRIPPDILDVLENNALSKQEVGMLVAEHFIGREHVTSRIIQSLQAVGQKSGIPGWPQLGSAATMGGAHVAYVARQIILGQELPSGRGVVNPEAIVQT